MPSVAMTKSAMRIVRGMVTYSKSPTNDHGKARARTTRRSHSGRGENNGISSKGGARRRHRGDRHLLVLDREIGPLRNVGDRHG